ncbi:MAG: hypothetical protein E7319_10440 [Clostridiales bacterium]|nr:hypothetical protein [Clostridiales bacterium]
MQHRIILCGGNGAGKSTLGRTLADAMKLCFMDIEDYYFPCKNTEYAYASPRSTEEVASLLLHDMKRASGFVLAAVKADYGTEISSMFTCAVFIDVPKEIRMQRIHERSYRKFGERMLPGGDLFEKEQRFFDMVQNRSDESILQWLDSLQIQVIHIDGLRPVEENAPFILERLSRNTSHKNTSRF